MTPRQFVAELGALRFQRVFNPYSDQCPSYDFDGAPARRSETLVKVLEVASSAGVDSIWVGRDLGYRGGRRTGLALTDDVHFHAHLKRWGVNVSRPTKGEPVPERTATVVWNVLDMIDRPIFLWNVFPLHPHEEGAPFTNRAHNTQERRAGMEVLRKLVKLLRPKRIVAIGNDADGVLQQFSEITNTAKVRHPSYGGQTEFIAQMTALYSVKERRLL